MYKIIVKNIQIFGYHGLYQIEKDKGQIFKVNVSYVPKYNVKLINEFQSTGTVGSGYGFKWKTK